MCTDTTHHTHHTHTGTLIHIHIQVVKSSLAVDIEGVFGCGDVHSAPPHIILAALLLNNAFVQWTAACRGHTHVSHPDTCNV